MKDSSVTQIGWYAALLAFLFALGYDIAQLLAWLNVLKHPHELFWLFLPSLFLAPAFMVVMICLHYSAQPGQKIWTAMGLCFGMVYCAFATLNYFTQLTVVVPAQINHDITETYPLIFKQGSFMFAVDCLGYFFMSFSTLFAAFAFRSAYKALYRWMLWNGLLIVVFIAAYFNPFFYFIGSVWAISFSVAMIKAMKFFMRPAPGFVP